MRKKSAAAVVQVVYAQGKDGKSYDYINNSLYRYKDNLISSYRRVGSVVLFCEICWIMWPILGTTIYGTHAVFSWIVFGLAFVRIFLLLQSLLAEKFPFQIATTVLSKPPHNLINDQWMRYFGIYGYGRPHGSFMLFSKAVHPLVILVVLIVQFFTYTHFKTNYFASINSILCIIYIIYTYQVNWYFIIFGIVIPRENATEAINI